MVWQHGIYRRRGFPTVKRGMPVIYFTAVLQANVIWGGDVSNVLCSTSTYYARQYEIKHGSAFCPVLSQPYGDSSVKLPMRWGRDLCSFPFRFLCWRMSSATWHRAAQKMKRCNMWGSLLYIFWVHEHCYCANTCTTRIFSHHHQHQRDFQSCFSDMQLLVNKFIIRCNLYLCVCCSRSAGQKANGNISVLLSFAVVSRFQEKQAFNTVVAVSILFWSLLKMSWKQFNSVICPWSYNIIYPKWCGSLSKPVPVHAHHIRYWKYKMMLNMQILATI